MHRSLRVLAATFACAVVPAAPATAGIWTQIPSGTTHEILAIEYQSASRFWFTTAAGAIFTRQPDGSFAQTRAPSGLPLNDIEFQAGGRIGLAVGTGGQVLRSTDAGATWTPIRDIPVAGAESVSSCSGSAPLGDVNAVRFAGNGRAWILAAGAQIATSQPADAAQVGGQGTWVNANRTPTGDCKIPPVWRGVYSDAFFIPWNPDVGYVVDNSNVFFTSNNLVSAAAKRPATLPWGSGQRVKLAGDPHTPSRMWATHERGVGRNSTGYTRDGWRTRETWGIGNPSARTFPSEGPADVDYAGGTVLAAGTAGLILNSVDGLTFYYSSADGGLETQRWTAAALASATEGAVGGDNGVLAVTSQANFVPPPPAPPAEPRAEPPVPSPAPTSPVPRTGVSWTSGAVVGKVRVLIGRSYVTLEDGQSIPLGRTVDARKGAVTINVAVNTAGATQTATLSKGLFQVGQRRAGSRATTTVKLRTPPGKSRACAAKNPPKGAIRSLSGTVKGAFTIIAGAARAEVRTGSWRVKDTCKGTTVRNVRGRVSVRPNKKARSVPVRAGRSHTVKQRLFAAKRKRG